jgi:hypothetical protein
MFRYSCSSEATCVLHRGRFRTSGSVNFCSLGRRQAKNKVSPAWRRMQRSHLGYAVPVIRLPGHARLHFPYIPRVGDGRDAPFSCYRNPIKSPAISKVIRRRCSSPSRSSCRPSSQQSLRADIDQAARKRSTVILQDGSGRLIFTQVSLLQPMLDCISTARNAIKSSSGK